jgi:hypothetical protein
VKPGLKVHKIFFAIPFDYESKGFYDYVITELEKEYGGKLIYAIGDNQIGWSGKYDGIESFKMHNADLVKHFVKQIREADIVLADLTDNNPNVHVELGIALTYNKNILRVTRQSYESLSFDIRNYKVEQYKTQETLLATIKDYLKLFFTIKELDFEHYDPEVPGISKLFHFDTLHTSFENRKNIEFQHMDSNFHMRDGKVEVTFKITDQESDEDWFGVYLRTGDNLFYRSILVYVRKNGAFEVASSPVTSHFVLAKTTLPGPCEESRKLTIEIDGDSLRADIDGTALEYSGLNNQSRGEVKFASWRSNAALWDVKMVCRDTIEPFDSGSFD